MNEIKYITEEQLEDLMDKKGLDCPYEIDNHSWDGRHIEFELDGQDYVYEYYMELDDYLEYMGEVIRPNNDEEWDKWIEENKEEFMSKEELNDLYQ